MRCLGAVDIGKQRLLLAGAHLQQEEARRVSRCGCSRHEKALPLDIEAHARRALAQLVPPEPAVRTAAGQPDGAVATA